MDLIGMNGARNVEGLAWPQSICGHFSLSIVEDSGLSRTIWSVAHELAHRYACSFIIVLVLIVLMLQSWR